MRSGTETLRSQDGVDLFLHQWEPDGPVRGIVQVVHGLAEHGARYARFAQALTAAGWVVVADDHRGHGRTATRPEDIGHFADEDGWNKVVADIDAIGRHARARWPGVPLVRFGHSMGSSLTLHALSRFPGTVDAAVLSGPTGVIGPLRKIGLVITKLERLRLGKHGRSKLLHTMSFGDFNKPFEPARTAFDWLSRDPAEVDKYINDPLCGFVVTTQHWHDHLIGLGEMVHPNHLARIPSGQPILVIAGAKDPVSKAGAQIPELIRRLRAVGISDVTDRLWPDGRHELLNDTVRDEVTSFVMSWLDDRFAR